MCGGFLGDVFRIGTAVVATAVAVVTLNPFAIAAAVGAVASTIGHYTGSKELQIAGGVIGAIGAIGGLANGAGLFDLADVGLDPASTGLYWGDKITGLGSATLDAGVPGSFDAAQAAVNAAGPVTVDTMPDLVNIAGGAAAPQVGLEAGGNPYNPLNNVAANAQAPGVLPEAAVNTNVAEGLTPSVGGGMINQPMFTATGGDSAHLATFGTENAPNVSANVPTGTPDPTGGVNGGMTTPATTTPTPGTSSPSIDTEIADWSKYKGDSGVWDKIWKFVDSNSGSRLTSGVLMAGGAFLSGATSSLTPAQVTALEAQADQNRAAANLSRQQTALSQQQMANMNETLPTATRTPPVTGTVALPSPRGLINTPPKLAPVTGRPA